MAENSNPELIASMYYDRGLYAARAGDLSGAIRYLKNALSFDKYCTDARNLLGLIYYTVGETAEAIVQWIISLNLAPEGNVADEYLEKLQRRQEVLESSALVIKSFNRALRLATEGSEDFAILELRDLTKEYPNYVSAQLLLAVLYMKSDENVKAGKALTDILKLDKMNPEALRLYDEVKRRTGRAEIEQAKIKNAFSHRQLEDDDVIIPTVKNAASIQQITALVAAGIALGLLCFYVLFLPGIKKEYTEKLNQDLIINSSALSSMNAEHSALKSSYEQLKLDYQDVRTRLDAFEKENADFTRTYEQLNTIMNYYRDGRLTEAVNMYLSLDRSYITVEPLTGQLQDIDRIMFTEGFAEIVRLGTDFWNGGDKQQAEFYYSLALSINGEDPETMYLLARLYQSDNRITEANEIFDRIIGEHPESPYAQRAVTARGY